MEKEKEQQNLALRQLQELLWSVLQNPLALRIAVVSVVALLGLGGAGMPLYFKVQELNAQYADQKNKADLMRANVVIKDTRKAYQERMSSKTEFIEWISEIRMLAAENKVATTGISPALNGSVGGEKGPVRLGLRATLNGSYANLIKFVGVLQNRREKVNVNELRFFPSGKEYGMSLSMAVLMSPPKKSDGKKRAGAKPAEPSAAQPPATQSGAESPKTSGVDSQSAPPVKPEAAAQTEKPALKHAASEKPPAPAGPHSEQPRGKPAEPPRAAPRPPQPEKADSGAPSGKFILEEDEPQPAGVFAPSSKYSGLPGVKPAGAPPAPPLKAEPAAVSAPARQPIPAGSRESVVDEEKR